MGDDPTNFKEDGNEKSARPPNLRAGVQGMRTVQNLGRIR